jgi:DNA-binding SARP family transcriptional activator
MRATLPTRPQPQIDLLLLKGFELRCDREVVPVVPSAQRLVAFVAVRDRPVRREHVSGTLWTDASERRASSSLRSALWRVPAPGGAALVEASNSHLWLGGQVRVDFRETLERAESVCHGGDDRCRVAVSEVAEFEDDLLPDWYEDWVIAERERFRQLRLHALERLCEELTEAGRFGQAIEAGLAAVASEPLRESAHRQVIKAHLGEGNVAEALRQYRSYARLLDAELGIDPSESLMALVGAHRSDRLPAPASLRARRPFETIQPATGRR